jgi:hypothetical protein
MAATDWGPRRRDRASGVGKSGQTRSAGSSQAVNRTEPAGLTSSLAAQGKKNSSLSSYAVEQKDPRVSSLSRAICRRRQSS